ncbi:hypothetical protein BgiBS90_023815 [Biomphalaria glabrata]|nr:hypothetical protein BgiBS90_023815 [Biomphalaria glabrata]
MVYIVNPSTVYSPSGPKELTNWSQRTHQLVPKNSPTGSKEIHQPVNTVLTNRFTKPSRTDLHTTNQHTHQGTDKTFHTVLPAMCTPTVTQRTSNRSKRYSPYTS